MATLLNKGKYFIGYVVVLCVILLAVEYITGKDIRFSIFFIFPACIAAWGGRRVIAYSLAIFLPLARLLFHMFWTSAWDLPSLEMVINAVLQIFMIITSVYVIDQVRLVSALKKELKTLEGILPICASCKKIRNEDGIYEPIEAYLSRHSEAQFTHGICPECRVKLYPELVDKDKKEHR
jgi:hypothetical protein